jgi:hypothetical protein
MEPIKTVPAVAVPSQIDPSVSADSLAQLEVAASWTTAIVKAQPLADTNLCAKMESESLGIFVRDGMIGVVTKLVGLKPYVEELWTRFDRGEVILRCSTRKEFCQQVLQRTPRAVRYMLEGGNHKRGETVSPPANPVEQPAPKPIPDSESDIWLEPCSRNDPRYEEIREDHYIENHGCIGQQAHFLIHYKGELAGIISGASPVYATSPRDKFFGVDKMNRRKFLQGIVNNVVFRLEVHEPNLATRVLKLWRNVIPHFWYEKYGTVVYGFETFVIENDTRKGSLYKADNWTLAGTTAGASKVRNGINKPADNWKEVLPKLVYCRWRDGFDHACSARTPEWTKKLYPNISSSSEEQPWKPRTIEERWAAAGSSSWSGQSKSSTGEEAVRAPDVFDEPESSEAA